MLITILILMVWYYFIQRINTVAWFGVLKYVCLKTFSTKSYTNNVFFYGREVKI